MKIVYKNLKEWENSKSTSQFLQLVQSADEIVTEDGDILKNRCGKITHDFDGDKRDTLTDSRKQISSDQVNQSIDEVICKLFSRLENDKGYGTFSSVHEILGILQEETHEFLEAVHGNVSDENLIEELNDIAVASIFAIACIRAKTLDW